MKLSFEHISKLYGDTAALQQIDLTLGSGVYGFPAFGDFWGRMAQGKRR